MPRKRSSPQPEADRPEKPSRSANKRAGHALQALGLEIARLTAAERAGLPLTPELAEAMDLLDRLTDREGRRRQEQYIGRLMRDVDEAPLRRAMAGRQARDAAEVARFHSAEAWRARLLEAPAPEVAPLLEEFRASAPRLSAETDAELVRAVEAARSARARGDTSPRAARVLFRALAAALGGAEGRAELQTRRKGSACGAKRLGPGVPGRQRSAMQKRLRSGTKSRSANQPERPESCSRRALTARRGGRKIYGTVLRARTGRLMAPRKRPTPMRHTFQSMQNRA